MGTIQVKKKRCQRKKREMEEWREEGGGRERGTM